MVSKKIIFASFLLITIFLFLLYFLNSNTSKLTQDNKISSNSENTGKKQTTTEIKNDLKIYTFSDVEKGSTKENCLTVIENKVYNLTKWINKHPGGAENILRLCGIDGTRYFKNKHGLDANAISKLESFFVSELKK